MRLVRLGLELGMELAAHEPAAPLDLHDLHQVPLRVLTGKDQAFFDDDDVRKCLLFYKP